MTDIPLCECQAERAAIMEHDGELDRESAEDYARLETPRCDSCPIQP